MEDKESNINSGLNIRLLVVAPTALDVRGLRDNNSLNGWNILSGASVGSVYTNE